MGHFGEGSKNNGFLIFRHDYEQKIFFESFCVPSWHVLYLQFHCFLSFSVVVASELRVDYYFVLNQFFFSIRIFFTDTDDSHGSRGREGAIFYSILPLPAAHEHWDIYLQLCMWDDYHVFLIATLVFTRLLLDEIYHLIKLRFEWLTDNAMFVCLLYELILRFC